MEHLITAGIIAALAAWLNYEAKQDKRERTEANHLAFLKEGK